MLKETIRKLAARHHNRIREIRRHLHMHPELSFGEEQTGSFIRETLDALQIPFTPGWAGHGVVGLLECTDPGSGVVALRADMDALPITEQSDVPYKSRTPGVMHACGHDVHMASLLGAATILSELRKQIRGTVKFVFQPGEEKLPGGASLMVAEGVLEDPKPQAILGQHVHPDLPAGSVGFRSGVAMASSDEITLQISGRGGHGAMPHLAIDPVTMSAQVITALQQVVSRHSNPLTPSVLTFGQVASEGGAFNVIPDHVILHGTFRTFDEDWRSKAHERISEIAHGICSALGGTCSVRIDRGYPVLVNDPDLTAVCTDAASEYLGPEFVHEIPQRLTSEDFAFYTHHVPGCFYRLGTGTSEPGQAKSVHTPTFDIDEAALVTGAGLMAWLAVARLAG